MSGAGELDRRILLQRADTSSTNDLNEPITVWFDLREVWAKREDASDREQFTAGKVSGSLLSRFKVRSNTLTRSLSTADRISYDGAIWDILGVKETTDGRRRFLWINAERSLDGD